MSAERMLVAWCRNVLLTSNFHQDHVLGTGNFAEQVERILRRKIKNPVNSYKNFCSSTTHVQEVNLMIIILIEIQILCLG